jgi:hypothetical protein
VCVDRRVDISQCFDCCWPQLHTYADEPRRQR